MRPIFDGDECCTETRSKNPQPCKCVPLGRGSDRIKSYRFCGDLRWRYGVLEQLVAVDYNDEYGRPQIQQEWWAVETVYSE